MLTGEQIRGARAMLRIDRRELAERAGVSFETIKRLERISGPISATTGTVEGIRRAIEAAGVEFTNGKRPGVRLRKGMKVGA